MHFYRCINNQIPESNRHHFGIYHIPAPEGATSSGAWAEHYGPPQGELRMKVCFMNFWWKVCSSSVSNFIWRDSTIQHTSYLTKVIVYLRYLGATTDKPGKWIREEAYNVSGEIVTFKFADQATSDFAHATCFLPSPHLCAWALLAPQKLL